MNTLPPSFGVLNDGSPEFEKVIEYLNRKNNRKYTSVIGVFYGELDGQINNVWPENLDTEQIILSISQFIEMTKEKQILTEDNIKDYGFHFFSEPSNWANYQHGNSKFGISLCKKAEAGFKTGDWVYGTDFIVINTVEELKMLYKLVTKKELI